MRPPVEAGSDSNLDSISSVDQPPPSASIESTASIILSACAFDTDSGAAGAAAYATATVV
ncbi:MULTISPECIES: hypothetical protein [Burkholderia]|uniref:hypothetical protein n=1 Tax=Burkholderia TaxID=32008 RepID=UPI00104CA2DA|nr:MULTISPECIES: hypothetical protein [Burkholderia]TDA42883.1 hypothetical protein EVG18_35885 [Burkholderia pyrrocinia]